MEHASDSHLEKVYALLLVALNPEQKAEVQQIMDVADAEYARTCTTLELLSEALEKVRCCGRTTTRCIGIH